MMNNPNLELQLFDGGRIAVPLAPMPKSTLKPKPNFLIIENVYDLITVPFPTPDGKVEMTECEYYTMKLVYREILPAEEGKQAMIRTVTMDEIYSQPVPVDFHSIFTSQKRLIAATETLNSYLPLFQFRGILKGYVLQHDPVASQRYLDLKEEANKPIMVQEPIVIAPPIPVAPQS